jgi:hypothetical protein
MKRLQRLVIIAVLIGGGLWVGATLPQMDKVRAEIQPTPPPQHFQSGSQQSVPILQEIAATLKQMDARLARIETAAKQFQPGRAGTTK